MKLIAFQQRANKFCYFCKVAKKKNILDGKEKLSRKFMLGT